MLRHLLTQRSCKLSNQRRFFPAVFRLCAVQNLEMRTFSQQSSDKTEVLDWNEAKSMDSFAQKPDRKGAHGHMRALVRKDKLQKLKPTPRTALPTNRKPETKQTEEIVAAAYQNRFGKQKQDLLKEMLLLGSDALTQQCKTLGMTFPVVQTTGKTSMQIMQLVFSYLEKFEAEALTESAQKESSGVLSKLFTKVPRSAKVDNGDSGHESESSSVKPSDSQQNTGLAGSEVSADTERQSAFRTKNFHSEYVEAAQRVDEVMETLMAKYSRNEKTDAAEDVTYLQKELILESGATSLFAESLIDVPKGPMRSLKPAAKFTFKPSFVEIRAPNQTNYRQTSSNQSVLASGSLEQIPACAALSSLQIDLSSVSASEKSVVLNALKSIQQEKLIANPNVTLQQHLAENLSAKGILIDALSPRFAKFVAFAADHIQQTSPSLQAQVVAVLEQVAKLPAHTMEALGKNLHTIDRLARLSLELQTSLPNLLELCKNKQFLIEEMLTSAEPGVVDAAGSCIVNFVRMARQDYHLLRSDRSHFEKAVACIQEKVEAIHSQYSSYNLQKSMFHSHLLTSKVEAQKVLNRLVLMPSPQPESRLQKKLGEQVHTLVKLDLKTDNKVMGLFTCAERNYIFARGMQVPNNKELQNDMRILLTSEKVTGRQQSAAEAILSGQIVSGKLYEDCQLNNVSHLAGLMPATKEENMARHTESQDFFRLDRDFMINLRLGSQKQYEHCTTLRDLRSTIEMMEFQQKYSPGSIWPNSKINISRIITSITAQTQNFVVPLEDLVRLQNCLLVSMQEPTYLFSEILAHKESFATAVSKPVLKHFVEDVLSRMTQHQVVFDHLANSNSVIHRAFLPYTPETFQVLSKLVDDLVGAGNKRIPEDNFALLNKILSLELVTAKVFDSSEKASAIIGRFLTQQWDMLNARGKRGPQPDQFSNIGAQIELLQSYDSVFKTLRSVEPLVSSDPKLLETIAASVELALKNLICDIQTFSTPPNNLSFFKTVFAKNLFPLDQLICTNKAILNAISSLEEPRSKVVMQSYLEGTPLSRIIDCTLLAHIGDPAQKDLYKKCKFFEDSKADLLLKNAIEQDSWAKRERLNGPLITYFNQVLDSNVLGERRKREFMELASRFLLKIQNSRSLFGVDLARFFKLIRQLQEQRRLEGQDESIYDHLLMNVACNLRTLGVNLLQPAEEDSKVADSSFTETNKERLDKDRHYKRMIFKMYQEVFARHRELFSVEHSRGLRPLSVIFAGLFDEMDFEEQVTCLEMLGSHSVDNYTEEFVEKLYGAFGQNYQIQSLMRDDLQKFIRLADKWPKFFQNNELTNALCTMDASRFSLEDQSRVLRITTHKNLVLPRFLNSHMNKFLLATDRERVKPVLANLLQSLAYVGFSENVNMEQVTQVLRRIYKEPSQVDIDQLLNFFIVLAVSNSRFQDFDFKSREFVEKALALIEAQFTGTKQIRVKGADSQSELNLFLFNSIPSTSKFYNKVLDRNTQAFESQEGRREFFQQAENALNPKFLPDEDLKEKDPAEFLIEPLDLSDEEIQSAGPSHPESKDKRIYDRNAADMNASYDEQQYFKNRNQKLAQMAKKDNHLLLYSNVNTLDFLDINTSNVAKAWVILFHFCGKSTESMLFEQFNSIALRNTISKTRNHEVFTKLYVELNAMCFKHDLQIEMASSCERTGWPIDITLNPFFFKSKAKGETEEEIESASRADQADGDQQYAVYFLLQEEICYNAETKSDEPLGLQKLMLRHLSQISNFKVCTIDENMTVNEIHSALDKISDEFFPLLSTPKRRHPGNVTRDLAPQQPSRDELIAEEEDVDDIVDGPQSMLRHF